MKFKEILTHHHDGSLEVKETVRIKCIGSETIVMPGRKLDKRFLTVLCGVPINEAMETDLNKDSKLNIWELSI
jgi:hypothetical protein